MQFGIEQIAGGVLERAADIGVATGFAAGFGYLVPEGRPLLDWSSVARRDRPRDRVPAGSVALAAGAWGGGSDCSIPTGGVVRAAARGWGAWGVGIRGTRDKDVDSAPACGSWGARFGGWVC